MPATIARDGVGEREIWLVTFVVTGLFPLDKPTTVSKCLLRIVLEGFTPRNWLESIDKLRNSDGLLIH